MKVVVLTKENEKLKGKVFTKKNTKDIIRKNYPLLKVSYKRRDGLLSMKSKELKEIKKDLKWKEKILINMFPKIFVKIYKKGIEKGFNSRL